MQLFDLHCDTLSSCYQDGVSLCCNRGAVDLHRGRRFAPWCQVFAAFIPDTVRGKAALKQCKRLLTYAREQEKRLAQQLSFVTDNASLNLAVRTGRCAGILAVENAAALAGEIENVDLLSKLGVRLMTLTWNGDNELGHGCLSDSKEGLTPFGRKAVRAMQRVGIVPDVSHLNEAGFWDVATTVDGPFVASHSVSRTVHEHPRNLTDAQFKEIRRRGGLVGVNFCEWQLGEQNFDTIYRHIAQYLSLGGEETVAFGGDLDGTKIPDEWNGIAVYEALWGYLLSRGLSESLLEAIFFKNAFNFFACTLQAHKSEV